VDGKLVRGKCLRSKYWGRGLIVLMVIVRDTEGVSNKNKTKTVYVARKTMNVFIFLNDKYNIV